MAKRVLVVVAHPDDESFWAGGELAYRASHGDTVSVVTLADGTSSRFKAPEYSDAVAARTRRRKHYRAALKALGAHELIHLEPVFPDQEADTVPQRHINRAVQKCVDIAKPDTIFTHWIGDLNIDHRRTAEAVLVATRPYVYPCKVYAMRPEDATVGIGPKWNPGGFGYHGVGLSLEAFAAKQVACRCYLDEIRTSDHPRNVETMQPFEDFYEYR